MTITAGTMRFVKTTFVQLSFVVWIGMLLVPTLLTPRLWGYSDRIIRNIGESTTIEIPGGSTHWVVGGGGRFILLSQREKDAIAVLDVSSETVIGNIPLPHEGTVFGAGRTTLLVADPLNRMLTKWNIESQKKIAETKLDFIPTDILVGSNAVDQAVLVATSTVSGSIKAYSADLNSLAIKGIEVNEDLGRVLRSDPKISPNGNMLFGKEHCFVQKGELNEWTRWNWRPARPKLQYPSFDFNAIQAAMGVSGVSDSTATVSQERVPFAPIGLLPSSGPFYMEIRAVNSVENGRQRWMPALDLFVAGMNQPIERINLFEPESEKFKHLKTNEPMTQTNYAFLYSQSKFAEINWSGDRIRLCDFDANQSLKNFESDYLVAINSLPCRAEIGQKLTHQIVAQTGTAKTGTAKTGNAPISYELEFGPDGLTVSKEGLLQWSPTSRSMKSNAVCVKITNESGLQLYQSSIVNVIGIDRDANTPTAPFDSRTKSTAELPNGKIQPPSELAELKLPERYTQHTIAASGRYLCLLFPNVQQVGVLDLRTRGFVGYIPTFTENPILSSTRTKLLVFDRVRGTVAKWSLADFTLDKIRKLPQGSEVLNCTSGCSSEGPVLVLLKGEGPLGNPELLDVDSLAISDTGMPLQSAMMKKTLLGKRGGLRALSSGRHFLYRNLMSYVVSGREVVSIDRTPPNNVRSQLNRRQTGSAKPLETPRIVYETQNLSLDAVSPTSPYYIRFEQKSKSRGIRSNRVTYSANLYVRQNRNPICPIPNFSVVDEAGQPASNCIFVPSANTILYFPTGSDSIFLHPLEVNELLKEIDIPYLYVDSQAVQFARSNELFRYTLSTKSKRGGLKFSLKKGPDGMSVTDSGEVNWLAISTGSSDPILVTIEISDAKDSIDYSFEIFVNSPILKLDDGSLAALKNAFQKRLVAAKNSYQKFLDSNPKGEFPVRVWTDTSGKFSLKARFSKVISKTKVELLGVDGKTKVIPLNRLKAGDAVLAVENELSRSLLPKSDASPFSESIRVGQSNPLFPHRLYVRIAEMVKSIESNSPKKYAREVFSTKALEAFSAKDENLDFLKTPKLATMLLKKLLQVDAVDAKLSGDEFVFESCGIILVVDESGVFRLAALPLANE